jgi:hypothetical protein
MAKFKRLSHCKLSPLIECRGTIKKVPQPKWHFRIRFQSPPMMVIMLEIYQTFQMPGFEFKRKDTHSHTLKEPSQKDPGETESKKRRRKRKTKEEKVKKAQDLYFFKTCCRLDNVIVSSIPSKKLKTLDPGKKLES